MSFRPVPTAFAEGFRALGDCAPLPISTHVLYAGGGTGEVAKYPCVASSLAGFIQQIAIGYQRGQGKWHPSVRIELEQYLCLRDHFLIVAVHRIAETLSRAFHSLPFEP